MTDEVDKRHGVHIWAKPEEQDAPETIWVDKTYISHGVTFVEADTFHRVKSVAYTLKATSDARITELENALNKAVSAMGSVVVFVNSKEKVKQPEGRELFEEAIADATRALKADTT